MSSEAGVRKAAGRNHHDWILSRSPGLPVSASGSYPNK
jgi:hypothetical protein